MTSIANHSSWKSNIHLLMLVCATLVSTSFIVGKIIAATLDPAALTLVRFIIAALILLPIIARRHGVQTTRKALLRYGLISGSLVIFFWCMFLSLRYTSALNTSVLFTLVPGLSGMYAALIVKERLGRARLLALSIGLVGAIWVIFRGDVQELLSLTWNRGDSIFFVGCLAMGLYTPLVKMLHRGEPMEVMTFWVLVTGIVWLLPIGGFALTQITWSGVPASTWAWVFYLAVFSTVVSFYITQFAIPVIGPTRTMAYSYLYPGLVLVIEVILGHGWPELKVIPGICIIIVAMFVLQRTPMGKGSD
ncbi:MAG: DMT family transporter [Deltaproteobacteria bacterium]|nr:DMT family transporter [Deltaproteobacteria bacterium]